MNSNPMISVVMPVYNAEKFLEEAIQSILTQTYKDFEFIIINDGSSDKSLEIIKKYRESDERIILVSRENKGLVFSLNEGIKKAKGNYIARMDADDISLPKRFEKQIKFLEKENIDICGSHYFIIDKNNKYISARVVSTEIDFNKIILTRSVPFAHGSVMFKKDFYINNNLKYGLTSYFKAEDYALWQQFSLNNARISNVDEFLFKYRNLDNTLSKQNINYTHSLELSKKYIFINYDHLILVFNEYINKVAVLNDFEKEQLSYFLIKTFLKGQVIKKLKAIKKIGISINIINFIRIIFGR
jgi:glycosyltransferase involved in cell wall biosynthesis